MDPGLVPSWVVLQVLKRAARRVSIGQDQAAALGAGLRGEAWTSEGGDVGAEYVCGLRGIEDAQGFLGQAKLVGHG